MLMSVRAAIVSIALAVVPASAEAASPFDGLWVADLKTQMGQAGYDSYLVQNGVYE